MNCLLAFWEILLKKCYREHREERNITLSWVKDKIRSEDAMQIRLAEDLSKGVHSRCVQIWALIQDSNLAFSTANYSKLHSI